MELSVQSSCTVALPPADAFAVVTRELVDALHRDRIDLDAAPDGHVSREGHVIGHVVEHEAGARLAIEWKRPKWAAGTVAVELSCVPDGEGTRVTVAISGLEADVGVKGDGAASWFGSQIAANVVAASTPDALADWVTDRSVRRPSGEDARENYGDPLWHWPNFDAILERLALTGEDRLVEIGCGGGAFMRAALESGCDAAAIDHSADMVRLAAELNAAAVADGRLQLEVGSALALPFASGRYTCAAMSGVLMFLDDQTGALAEIHRVLAPGGRLVLYSGSPAMSGTPAAPEPYASRLHFMSHAELEKAARAAGFSEVVLEQPDLRPYARARGLKGRGIGIFAPKYGQLLIARKQPDA